MCISASRDIGFCDQTSCNGNCNALSQCGTQMGNGFCFTPGTESILVSPKNIIQHRPVVSGGALISSMRFDARAAGERFIGSYCVFMVQPMKPNFETYLYTSACVV
ncbi:hypothetical protein C8Q77DRAFT_1150458 [Trametes polyzona]|nr:hypothetical protein C8Q77DRAFT_1150458 [Trametes polyzona]